MSLEQSDYSFREQLARRRKLLLGLFLIATVLAITFEDVDWVEHGLEPTHQIEYVISVDQEADVETQNFQRAAQLVSNVEMSEKDVPPEGGGGPIAQVINNVTEEYIEEKFGFHVDFDTNTTHPDIVDPRHHLGIVSYFYLADRGTESPSVILGGRIALQVRNATYDIVTLFPFKDLEGSHEYDQETTAFLLREDPETGENYIDMWFIKTHEGWRLYPAELIRNDGERMTIVSARGKKTNYPEEALCNSRKIDISVDGYDIFVVSGDVCDAEVTHVFDLSPEGYIGPPGGTHNPIIGNADFALFPEDIDPRFDMVGVSSEFEIDSLSDSYPDVFMDSRVINQVEDLSFELDAITKTDPDVFVDGGLIYKHPAVDERELLAVPVR